MIMVVCVSGCGLVVGLECVNDPIFGSEAFPFPSPAFPAWTWLPSVARQRGGRQEGCKARAPVSCMCVYVSVCLCTCVGMCVYVSVCLCVCEARVVLHCIARARSTEKSCAARFLCFLLLVPVLYFFHHMHSAHNTSATHPIPPPHHAQAGS